MCHHVAILLSVLSGATMLCGPGPLDGAPASARRPVPDKAALQQAQQLIREVYGKEYEQAKTSQEKTALARKLLAEAAENEAEPASHFVLLRVAKEIAMAAGDAGTALDAVGRLASAYDLDALAMKVEAVEGARKAARMPSQLLAVAGEAFGLVDEAVAADEYDQANRAARLAGEAARRGREYALVRQVAERLREIKDAERRYEAVVQAREVLRKSPADPEENLTVGRYLCLVKGDWEKGVPMLALGSDPALKTLAVKELKSLGTTDAQVELGDGWWDVAQSKEASEKQAFMLRAGAWYGRARAELNPGLVKAKVEKRLRDLAPLARPTSAATAPEAIAPPGQPVAVWQWDPKKITAEYRTVEFDVSRWISAPGTYELRWQYEKGWQRLDIQGVVLLRHGRPVDRDVHDGYSGSADQNNTYTLKLERVPRRAKFGIQASIRGGDGNDSYGTAWLQRLGD